MLRRTCILYSIRKNIVGNHQQIPAYGICRKYFRNYLSDCLRLRFFPEHLIKHFIGQKIRNAFQQHCCTFFREFFRHRIDIRIGFTADKSASVPLPPVPADPCLCFRSVWFHRRKIIQRAALRKSYRFFLCIGRFPACAPAGNQYHFLSFNR